MVALIVLWWEYTMMKPMKENILKILNINLPYDTKIPFLGIYTQNWNIYLHKDSTLMFLAALFIRAMN